MRRCVAWVTRAATLAALLGGATTTHAQNPLTIDDARVVEQSAGTWTFNTPGIRVWLPSNPTSPVTVNWTLVAGSATAGSDFVMNSGTLTFSVIDSVKYINTIQIIGDTADEWNLTRQDEVFFVELSSPSANASINRGRATVTLIDDDLPMPGVQFLAAVTGTSLGADKARLYWRVPGAQTPVNDVVIRWNTGAGCAFPGSTTAGTGGTNTGGAPIAGSTQYTDVSGLTPSVPYCFSVFAIYGGGPTTEVAKVSAVPFDGSASIKWRYATGSTSVVPPTVSADGVYTTDNSGVVHAMQRGPNGGFWLAAWDPISVGAPTQNRSAVVPLKNAPVYADYRLFLGTDGGGIHALDARSGHLLWSRSARFAPGSPPLPTLGGVQAQPAGLFKSFSGNNDMLLVGTSAGLGNNSFVALDPKSGNTLSIFPDSGMGDVRGMAAVDYGKNRVYFLSAAANATFFALDLGPSGLPSLTLSALPGGNRLPFGSGSSGSLVLRNNHVVFGDSSGQVYGIDLGTGTSYSTATGDGQVKGFVWPDRRNTNLYFSTTAQIQGLRDDGSSFSTLPWSPITSITHSSVTSPSILLQKPGTDFLYFGNNNGELVQVDVSGASPVVTPLRLEVPGVQIGAPSLDGGYDLLIVGSSTGTLHAVHVPF